MANSTVKTINDYIDKMCEMYPTIDKKDIKKILVYGWRQLYLMNAYGGDVCLKSKDYWSYIGTLKKDSLRWYHYYRKKLCVKIRVMYKRKKIPWDGYYYFALTDNQYKEYIESKNKRGRPRKYFTFKNIVLYQILDECKVARNDSKYIFRIPYITTIKYTFFKRELVTDKAELIITRDPLKFADMMISNNKYDTI